MKQPSIHNTKRICLALQRLIVCCGFMMIIANPTQGQVSQTHRYEREHKGGDESYTLVSLKEEGLALIREKDKYHGNKRVWELVILDTALQEKKVIQFDIETRQNLIGYEIAPKHIYLLYR